ncbi:hypothetical protein EYS42_09420 [Aquabacterium lacunae]|uniref:Uncharacterized protein n=1 Tax=Aquabacterium lacunae TaxID=2528630 RepID=A0A4Q9H4H6_9BURK|nr:hypothetical protein [Aquabacterium lacunae]TBO31442.1 hypothetical protein EYS42_09420 [Aquabacterium lacunae]
MIPVAKVPEPDDFDGEVRTPGRAWLKANPTVDRPPALWSGHTQDLAEGFANLCGYAAMLDPTGGTVDHYLSCKNHRELTYEWSNYRFASGTLNSSKKNADDTVLDPYEVQAGWFEILLPSLQMRVTDAVPAAMRAKAEFTLKRLKLRDGERIIRWRQSWYAMYKSGGLTLDGLRQVAPLIAEAVDKVLAKGGVAP